MPTFDSLGSTDNARISAANAYHKAHGGRVLEPIILPSRVVTHSVPIELWSGARWVAPGGPAREYSRGSVLKYTGTGAQFRFTRTQTAQGYPGDGSPRDSNFECIQFEGSGDCFESYDPTTYPQNGHGRVAWMTSFWGCGWKHFNRIYWGWWDGLNITGPTHTQGIKDTPFYLGGSESTLFGAESSFMDNNTWQKTPKPFIRSRMEKSTIGRVMPTARGWSYQLKIEAGNNLEVNGARFDSQDSDPVSGASVRIEGGVNLSITNCSFKGQANDLAGAFEHGLIEVTRGRQITIMGNNFLRDATKAPPDTPLVYAGPNVQQGAIIFGPNNFEGFTGIVHQYRPGQIISTDPRITVRTQQ